MKAKAAVLTGPRTLEIREIATPDRPPEGGALLAIEGCGLCGSDVEQYEGVKHTSWSHPVIPGHEILGRISALDAAAARLWGLKEGDRVVVNGVVPCGVCGACRKGLRCAGAFYYGYRSLDIGSGLWGGYSERLEIAPGTRLTPVSSRLTVEDALLFNPLAAGFDWVIRLAQVKVGEIVLITGAGQRGLACVIAAREAGAGTIIVTGLKRDRFKLDIAHQMGATHTLVVEECDIRAEIAAITQGLGVEKAIETTPLAFSPISDAIASMRAGGVIVLAGLKGLQRMPEFPIDDVIMQQLRLIGALSTTDWAVQQAIRVIEGGRYRVHLMHSHTLPLERAENAIQLLAGKVASESALHITLTPN